MYSKQKSSRFRTVTLRLTVWYAALSGALSAVVFLTVFLALRSSLDRRTDLELLSKVEEFEALYTSRGSQALVAEFQREAGSQGAGRVFFRLLSPTGEVIVASNLRAWHGLENIVPSLPGPLMEAVTFQTLSVPGRRHQVRMVLKRAPDGRVIQVGVALRNNELLAEKYWETFAMALGLMLVCGGLVGWLVARRAMSGVERVTQAAVHIGKSDLNRLVPLGHKGREIEELALAFNSMLERIQALVRELKGVTNNIAHDLRTPITRIRGIAETTLTGEADLAAYREMAGAVIEESDRLVEMINTMLEIAQAESGVAKFTISPVDVRKIIQGARELFLSVAEDKGVRLEAELPSEPLSVLGDLPRLQRVMANLLDNAIKYTAAGGRVSLAARANGSRVIIEVTDTGAGIPPAEIPRIFDRFYRGDKSRSAPGSGLGLSLALAVVRAQGGDITVSSEPGRGSTFAVSLPRASSNK